MRRLPFISTASATPLFVLFAIIVALTGWAPEANAYQFYSDATNDQGGCAQCHTGFRDNGAYVSQAEGVAWGTSLHNAHLNNTDIGSSCDNCHGGPSPNGGRQVNLSESASAKDDVNFVSCSGCHGRFEDANTVLPVAAGFAGTSSQGWGAGLRQHHMNAGAPADINGDTCVTCHGDADPAAFTTAPENSLPPWYPATTNDLVGLLLEPCNASLEEKLAGLDSGLDNDGDLDYDGDDSDCGDVNEAPVANDDAYATDEDTLLNVGAPGVLGNDTDGDGDTLTAVLDADVSNGTLSLASDGSFSYTPDPDYNGPDAFTYHANDGTDDSNIATVDITVNDINDPPVADDQSVTTDEDTSVAITLTASDADGDTLTYSVSSGPSNGTLSGTAPNLTYTPNADYNGSDGFTFVANDGLVDSNTATVSITVNAVNDPPTADDQSVTTPEDTPVAITLTGADVDGDPLTYSVASGPSNGTLSGTAPNLTYTPNAGYNGPDSFTFVANDGTVDSNVATVSITVTPVNNEPVADDQSVTTDEDTSVAITLTASDADGDPLTYSVSSGPSNGTLSGTAPNLTYTPSADYNGSDGFTFVANDGLVDSNTATVSITVNAVNDPPTADDQSVTTPEDTPVAITLTGADVDGDPLTYSVASGPSNGTLSGTAPNLTYTPNAGYNGPDSFTFVANDGTVDSNVATVSITVTPVNNEPVADDQSVTTDEDTSVAITLTASDADGDPLTYSVSSGPSNGMLSGTAPNLTYTPSADYNGSDSFTFVANDGTVDSNVATVSITVNAVNDPPTADDQSVTTPEDTPVAITLTGADVDGDPLTYSVASGPSNGTLSGTAPNLTYTPNAGYNGPDSFTFVANDGTVDSNVATVSITVTPVNNEPVADDQSVTTDEDTSVAITLTASDADGDPLTYSVSSGPSNGTLSGTAPNLTYTPSADYNGSDSFTFVANDGTVDSNVATVSITVNAVNDPPTADDQSVTTPEDTPVAITLTGADVDGDPLTYSVASGPSNGTLSGTAPNLTYTPNAGYNGPDSFTFVANDGTVDSNVATVSITVTPVNNEPVADDQSVTTDEDTSVAITLTASDADGDPLTYSVSSGPSNGMLSGTAPNLTYTPSADYNGSDSFTFVANDGQVDSNTATVSITVNAVNDPPTADDQSVTTPEDTPVAITLTGADVDGDPLTYSVASGPSNGTLSGTAPNLTYTPNAGYNGPDSFTFVANDGTVDSNVATVSITVTPVNNEPVADDQSVTTDEDTSVAITLTASDADGDPLTYSVSSGPSNGTLSGTAPNLTYTPSADYNGSDSFTFVANDGTVDSNVATVSITVNAVNDPPTADDQSVTTPEDTPVAITLTGADVDGDTLTYSVASGPSNGTLSGTAPNLTYTPNAGYNGPDSFTFVANDGTVDSNVATVSITVTPVNNEPVADDQSVTTDEDTSVAITLTASDADGDPLTYSVSSGPSNGTLSGTAPNLTYTPSADYNGSDSFTFVANDGLVDSNIATVDITVNDVNDPPVADANGPYTGTVGIPVLFDGSASFDIDGAIVTYDWDYGDGTVELDAGPTPSHTYSVDLVFNVTLTVTDDGGLTSIDTTTATIAFGNQPPVADPNGPYDGTIGVPLAFDGTGSFDPDGTIVSYDWDFGDGNFATGPTPLYTYITDGIFNVTLMVTDDFGTTDSAGTTATITIPGVLDLDPVQFKVTKQVRLTHVKPIAIKLVVKNNGNIEGMALATITGVQDGITVYNESFFVTDALGNGRTTYTVPSVPTFVPMMEGDIVWKATIDDESSDLDEIMAVTTVSP